jgi:hypothetical protein
MTYYRPQDEYGPYLSAYTAIAFNWLRESGHAIPGSRGQTARLPAHAAARNVVPDFYRRA